jgi:hypothetical protein
VRHVRHGRHQVRRSERLCVSVDTPFTLSYAAAGIDVDALRKQHQLPTPDPDPSFLN